MKGKTILLFWFLGWSLGAQDQENPEIRFLMEECQGRSQAAEVRAETRDWGAWVRSHEASSQGGARFGPVMAGPLLLTSPGPERWGWAWNRRAAAGSFGAVAGWNQPLSLWVNQNSSADECGLQLRGQWDLWSASTSYRRRLPTGTQSRPEGSWVDQVKGGFALGSRNLGWENGGSLYLPQRGGRGLEGTTRFRGRWGGQELRATIT